MFKRHMTSSVAAAAAAKSAAAAAAAALLLLLVASAAGSAAAAASSSSSSSSSSTRPPPPPLSLSLSPTNTQAAVGSQLLLQNASSSSSSSSPASTYDLITTTTAAAAAAAGLSDISIGGPLVNISNAGVMTAAAKQPQQPHRLSVSDAYYCPSPAAAASGQPSLARDLPPPPSAAAATAAAAAPLRFGDGTTTTWALWAPTASCCSIGLLLLLLLLAVLAIQRFIISSCSSSSSGNDLDRIPGPWTRAVPLLGNIPQLLRPDFHRVLLRWADQYGGFVRLKFLWYDTLMVTDPAALSVICGRGEGSVDKAAQLYAPINRMCSPHGAPNLLTSAADDGWRAVRRAVARSFAFGNIRAKFPLIRGRTAELVEWLRRRGPGEAVDVDQAALRVTLDIIGLTAFGHDYGCTRLDVVPYDHLLRVLPRAFTEVMQRIANPLRGLTHAGWFKNGHKGRQSFVDFQAHMHQLLGGIKARGPPPAGDTDLGAQLYRVLLEAEQQQQQQQRQREAKKKETETTTPASSGRWWGWRRSPQPPRITEERILSEIGILFVEGFETTGHTISWTLFNIATTPGVQEAVAEELDSMGLLVRGQQQRQQQQQEKEEEQEEEPQQPQLQQPQQQEDDGGRSAAARPLEFGDLKRLRYLTACVKEAMRMYPVVSVMARCTTRPTRIGPYLVPAGTPIATPLFAIHNTIHNWTDPLEFRPERWLDVPLESYTLDMRAREATSPSAAAAAAPAAAAATNRPSSGGRLTQLEPNVSSSDGRHCSESSASASASTAASCCCSAAAAADDDDDDEDDGPPSARTRNPPPAPPPSPPQRPPSSPSSSSSSSSSASPDDDEDAAADGDDEGDGGVGRGRCGRQQRPSSSSSSSTRQSGQQPGISFMPFSEGPRSCVGQSLAKLEVVTVLAMILANFRIELAEEMGGREGVRQRESTHLTLQTKGTRGIRMHLHPRDQEP
ncbi:hypothetical protein PLESTB_001281900 [Pleodorina starrii]|uniref:Cytochrome P450 n=1 Tax=Pleodorina starrii TaxID=330485 RepID=A0A9W6BT18_9CHLO|nr:hypothetical protein PLESTM_001942900 [Pleodorina starrii]GLC57859.1 hypothetical protein PLESTB_001281900 [Pleodorina starrii]GLC69928.1 hypothetical protein PLESTF_000899600 [Pleodorina starrii]